MNTKTMITFAVAAMAFGTAAGFFGARSYERSQCAKRADAAVLEAEKKSGGLRSSAEQWADSLAKAEGEAIARSFVAGLAPVVLGGRESSVDIAGASLLRLSGVRGVTILRADGKTLYASDAKLTVSDAGNEQTRWALTATDFMTRASIQPEITEMAIPVTDRGTVLAIVWLSYDPSRAREQSRPEDFRSALTVEPGAR